MTMKMQEAMAAQSAQMAQIQEKMDTMIAKNAGSKCSSGGRGGGGGGGGGKVIHPHPIIPTKQQDSQHGPTEADLHGEQESFATGRVLLDALIRPMGIWAYK